MKPDVWYCFGDFEGCVAMPEDARHGSGRSIATLAGMGFVESVPVFEGFMTMKHRITSEGIAWLKNR